MTADSFAGILGLGIIAVVLIGSAWCWSRAERHRGNGRPPDDEG